MGSSRLGVVAGDRLVGVEHLEQLLVVGIEQLGLGSCGHWFEPLLQSHIVTGFAEQRFAEIGSCSLLEAHCNRCMIVAETQDLLVEPESLAATHIAVDNSCYKHCVVAGRKCSKRRIDRVQRRKRQIGADSGTGVVGLDSLRMGFGWKELVD